jgi:hypothetical protein
MLHDSILKVEEQRQRHCVVSGLRPRQAVNGVK